MGENTNTIINSAKDKKAVNEFIKSLVDDIDSSTKLDELVTSIEKSFYLLQKKRLSEALIIEGITFGIIQPNQRYFKIQIGKKSFSFTGRDWIYVNDQIFSKTSNKRDLEKKYFIEIKEFGLVLKESDAYRN